MREILLCAICHFLIVFSTIVQGAGATQSEPVKAAIESDGVQRIHIVGGSYFFKPNHIIVKVRTPVELTLVKEQGVAPHTFVVQAPEAGIAIDKELSTEPSKVAFTPSAPGKYAFYCSNKLLFLPSHRQQGMEGILEVVE